MTFRLTALIVCTFLIQQVDAQYFGQNKPMYREFPFTTLESRHFVLHHYLKDSTRAIQFLKNAENWYRIHSTTLGKQLHGKNPILLYNNHAEFQQTNAISGFIQEGTGGVTEALKNRVVLPFMCSHPQTDHVLGHELVHAFQYDMILNGDSTNLNNLQNIPLWMVEGLAEYLSIGRVDMLTSMWMRDRVHQKKFPTLIQLDNPEYFPYRYGQAFWSYVTGRYGDQVISRLFYNTALYGLRGGVDTTLQISLDSLSSQWTRQMVNHHNETLQRSFTNPPGKKLIDDNTGGDMNIAPELSPDGRYLIYVTEKNLLSLDWYLADARTGKNIRKVLSSNKEGHLDDITFIESSGTWSPDNKKFAIPGVRKGKSVLLIKDVSNGKTKKLLEIKGVPYFINPSWSPDGKQIVVSGTVEGQTDLYAIEVATGKTQQLTNDAASELQPDWSPDGSTLVFATEQADMEGGKAGIWDYQLCLLNVKSGAKKVLPVFPGADNLNPRFDGKGNIYFLSDAQGIRNVYRLHPDTMIVYQLTNVRTGICGITPFSPALSVGVKRDRVVYSLFEDNKYIIYQSGIDDFIPKVISSDSLHAAPALIYPITHGKPALQEQLLQTVHFYDTQNDSMQSGKYRPRIALDFLGGGGGIGIGNNNFGANTNFAGGVAISFSDMLGNHQVISQLNINGSVEDIGGEAYYINSKKRIGWGGGFSHYPFISAIFLGATKDSILINGIPSEVIKETFDVERTFENKFLFFSQYPFSKRRRAEIGANFNIYSSKRNEYYNYYDPITGLSIGSDRSPNLNSTPTFLLINTNAALVGDHTQFGLTGPLAGWRYRLEVAQYFGKYSFTTTLVDARKYFYRRPFSIALRGLSYNRMGQDAYALTPLYAASFYLVHSFDFNDIIQGKEQNLNLNQLIGSKLAVGNIELRLPFFGPAKLSLIPSRFLFMDLVGFLDGSMAYDTFSEAWDGLKDTGDPLKPKPLLTAGIGARFNIFGALVLEPYYAWPVNYGTKAHFGFTIFPGW